MYTSTVHLDKKMEACENIGVMSTSLAKVEVSEISEEGYNIMFSVFAKIF